MGRGRGGSSTKTHVVCEGVGKAIIVEATPGEQHGSCQAVPLLDAVSIAGKPDFPRKRLKHMSGDKAYDSEPIRQDIRCRRSKPVIAHRKRPDGTDPPSARGLDKKRRRRRNVAEQLTGKLEEFRRIATRYDKLAASSECFVLPAFIRLWLRDLLPCTA